MLNGKRYRFHIATNYDVPVITVNLLQNVLKLNTFFFYMFIRSEHFVCRFFKGEIDMHGGINRQPHSTKK